MKGGFKAEKLEKRNFHLDAIRNPFATNEESDEEEEPQEEKQEEKQSAVTQPTEED